jgi:uncharacterized protein YegP (UPF0339 family)
MVASKPPFPKFISRHFLKAGYPIQIVLQTYVPYGQRGAQRVFWVIYRTTKGEWRWTLFARNGRVLGASSEAFKRRRACLLNAGAHGCPLACTLPPPDPSRRPRLTPEAPHPHPHRQGARRRPRRP